jgi:ABC-type transport system substrate-binding protein
MIVGVVNISVKERASSFTQEGMNVMKNSSWPIYVTGPMQIVFHLKAPFVYFPGTLVVFEGLIFDTQWVLDNGGFGLPTGMNTYFDEHPIPGTGPYVITKVSENSYVEFSQNPNYWGAKLTPTKYRSSLYSILGM